MPVQTDNDISQLVERMSIGGSKVVAGVGKGVKLLGKLGKNLLQRGGSEGGADPGLSRGASSVAGSAPSQGAMLTTVVSSSAAAPLGDEDMAVGGPGGAGGDGRGGGILAIVVTTDCRVWVGHKGGRIDCYSSAGQLVWSKECAGSILSMCSVAQRIWVGFADGMLRCAQTCVGRQVEFIITWAHVYAGSPALSAASWTARATASRCSVPTQPASSAWRRPVCGCTPWVPMAASEAGVLPLPTQPTRMSCECSAVNGGCTACAVLASCTALSRPPQGAVGRAGDRDVQPRVGQGAGCHMERGGEQAWLLILILPLAQRDGVWEPGGGGGAPGDRNGQQQR